jgi:hypothetical protein
MSSSPVILASIKAAAVTAGDKAILTPDCLAFLAQLHLHFNARRLALVEARQERQRAIDGGAMPTFLAETAHVRAGHWKAAPVPRDILDRRVEITGPPERKMVINALNSGAKVFMADFEDSMSPTWRNALDGQQVGAITRARFCQSFLAFQSYPNTHSSPFLPFLTTEHERCAAAHHQLHEHEERQGVQTEGGT